MRKSFLGESRCELPNVFCRAIKQDPEAPSVKKLKSEDPELDKLIEKQNKEYFKLRDALQAQTNKHHWLSILRANEQNIPEGPSDVSGVKAIREK